MEAIETPTVERVDGPATVVWSGRPVSRATALAEVRRLTWQLPVLFSGGWSPPALLGNAEAALRLQAGLFELDARGRTLAPGAARAARLLTDLLSEDGFDVEACRVAARLVAHLELRARFG